MSFGAARRRSVSRRAEVPPLISLPDWSPAFRLYFGGADGCCAGAGCAGAGAGAEGLVAGFDAGAFAGAGAGTLPTTDPVPRWPSTARASAPTMNSAAQTAVARDSSVAPLRAPNAVWLLLPQTPRRCRRPCPAAAGRPSAARGTTGCRSSLSGNTAWNPCGAGLGSHAERPRAPTRNSDYSRTAGATANTRGHHVAGLPAHIRSCRAEALPHIRSHTG